MSDPSKDFTPIQGEYDFFAEKSTEAKADLDAYARRLSSFDPPDGPIHMLDFGCGPGTFTAMFLDRLGWRDDRLELTLVEPSAAYRERAVERLKGYPETPIRVWDELPPESAEGFDLILSNHALYYVADLEETLSHLARSLTADGLFVTAISGRHNALVDFWFRGFPLIGRPVPHHSAEDVDAALAGLGRPYKRHEVHYDLIFPDEEENRMKILRFLFSNHLADLPRDQLLAFFDPFAKDGMIEIRTGNTQFYVG